jgi:RecA-family ATPase
MTDTTLNLGALCGDPRQLGRALQARAATRPPDHPKTEAPAGGAAGASRRMRIADGHDHEPDARDQGHTLNDWPDAPNSSPASADEFDDLSAAQTVIARASGVDDLHVEARRLLDKGFKLVKLVRMSKRPEGNGWNLKPTRTIDPAATGYGLLLQANGLMSVDPDDVDIARLGLRRCGFDLDELMAAGARTTSTRPGSGGRSTFKAPAGAGWFKFSSKGGGVALELRAASPNLQDCLPGTRYFGKSGAGPYQQAYATTRRIDEAPELPQRFRDWYLRCCSDVVFLREQQALFFGGATDAALAISAPFGEGSQKLAFPSPHRVSFNDANDVKDILGRHGYQPSVDGRWSAPSATGAPGIRCIPGKDDLWRSDHASDPLFGTFDAWTAHVVLDHSGDVEAAEASSLLRQHAQTNEEFGLGSATNTGTSAEPAAGAARPVLLDWDALPLDPPAPRFLIPGWLPAGVVTLWAAHGGSGKSFTSLLVALCVATGRHPFAPGESIPRQRVLIYSAEDEAQVLQWRLRRYLTVLGIGPHEVKGWLHVMDATSSQNVLFAASGNGIGKPTAQYAWLKSEVDRMGIDLLVLDTAADVYGGDEIKREMVRAFMGSLRRLAPTTLLLSHVDAASSITTDPSKSKGYSGSTAWHNSVRSRWAQVSDLSTGGALLQVAKSNYGPIGAAARLRWSPQDQVWTVAEAVQRQERPQAHRVVLLDLLRRLNDSGQAVSTAGGNVRSPYSLMKVMPTFPLALTASAVMQEVSSWMTEGLAVAQEYTADFKTKTRLVITEAGRELIRSAAVTAADGTDAEDFGESIA